MITEQIQPALADCRSVEMITKRELSSRAQVSIRTVENWQARKILPFYRIGRVVLFDWVEVVQHLKANFRVNSHGLLSPKPENPKA